jgi:hypothetical protein
MDWIEIDFVNQIEIYLKIVQEREFIRNSFSQGKIVGLGLFIVTMILKMVLNGIYDL